MKTMKRLTAITLVLLLLLSLCGCMAEEPIEEISRPETTRTTPATTLSTAPTTAATVTITDTTGVTTDATADTATQTATTVVTTQVTTKVTVTATGSTAAPTTAAPTVKPLVEWNVIEEKAKEGPLPGTAIDFIKVKTFYDEYIDDFTENRLWDKECVIIENKQQFDVLFTNVYDPEYIPGMSAQLDYTQEYFEDNVLIVLEQVSSDTNCGGYWITGISVDNGTLHTNIVEVEIGDIGGAALTPFYVLIELRREDVQGMSDIVVYSSVQEHETFDDYTAWREEHADRFY